MAPRQRPSCVPVPRAPSPGAEVRPPPAALVATAEPEERDARIDAPSAETLAVARRVAELSDRDQVAATEAAEAIRLRLTELIGAGDGLDDAALTAELRALALSERSVLRGAVIARYLPRPATLVALVPDKLGDVLSIYERVGDEVQRTLSFTGTGQDLKDQLLVLDYAVFEPPGAQGSLVALVHTHPWMSSCWRGLWLKVLAPGGDPDQPTILVDERASGRWCETPTLQVEGDTLRMNYLTWAEFHGSSIVTRPTVLRFRTSGGGLVRLPPDTLAPEALVEEWAALPAARARELVTPAARSRLDRLHERLRRELDADRGSFRQGVQSLGPGRLRITVTCCDPAAADQCRHCAGWPRAVHLVVETDQGHSSIVAVQ